MKNLHIHLLGLTLAVVTFVSLGGCATINSVNRDWTQVDIANEHSSVGEYKVKNDSDSEAAKLAQFSGLMKIDEDGIERYIPPDEDLEEASVKRAFADGVIDEAEYQEAFRHWKACVEAKNSQVIELEPTEEEPWLINYSTTESYSEKSSCYAKFYSAIDNAWQMSYADYSASAVGMRMFLDSKGVKPKHHEWQLVAQIEYLGLGNELAVFLKNNQDSVAAKMREENSKMLRK